MIEKQNSEMIDITKQYPEKLVYIDFESVSVPFAYDSGLGGEYPYAYSAIIYGEKDIFTYVYESSNTHGNIYALKSTLLKFLNINGELGLKNYRFVGWNGGLERKVLSRMFRDNFKYTDLMLSDRFFSAALDDVAAKDVKFELGFEYTRSLVNQRIKDAFIKRKNGKLGDFEPKTDYKNLRSGAIACLVGAIKYGSLNTRGKKWILKKMDLDLSKIDLSRITKELYKYSKHDVQDMIDISENFERSVKRYNFLKSNQLKRVEYKKEYWNYYGMLKKINTFYNGEGDTNFLFCNFIEENKSSYLDRAYNSLNCDELDFDMEEEVSRLVDKYKRMEAREILRLKEMLVKEDMFYPSFSKIFDEFTRRKELYKAEKDALKLKTKNEVKFIK